MLTFKCKQCGQSWVESPDGTFIRQGRGCWGKWLSRAEIDDLVALGYMEAVK